LPILVRPVREQLEHDRVIRLLQAKWKKKFDVEVNVGEERAAFVKIGDVTVFPDLVLSTQSSPRRLQGLVEVETGESVNNLEAMAQWAHMSRAKVPFQLYVPVSAIDQARRLCVDHQIALAELWSYYVFGEQVRFTLVNRNEARMLMFGKTRTGSKTSEPTEEVLSEVLTMEPPRQPAAVEVEVKPERPAASKRPAVEKMEKKASPKAKAAVLPSRKPVRAVNGHGKLAVKRASGSSTTPPTPVKGRAGQKAKPIRRPVSALQKSSARSTKTARPTGRAKSPKATAKVAKASRRR
jgi:hypothetical protein